MAKQLVDDELGLTVEFQTFDAEDLAKMGSDPKNWRAAERATVDKYLRLMRAGKWEQSSGIPLVIGKNGHVIDGGHRAAAAAEFQAAGGDPIRWIVVRGGKPSINEVVDSGLARKFPQWVRQMDPDIGIKQASTISAICRSLGVVDMAGKGANPMGVAAHGTVVVRDSAGGLRRSSPSTSEMRLTFARKQDLVMQWTRWACKLDGLSQRPACIVKVACMMACASGVVGDGPVGKFAGHMLGWANLPDGHPAAALMNALIRMAVKAGGRGVRSDSMTACALTVKAIKAYIAEDRVKVLSWRLEEAFPSLQ
jgi:hypothetical protein